MNRITETLGYHYKSLVLDGLPSAFQASVNVPIGITGAIAALVHIVLLGGVKLGLWMCLPLLFSVIPPSWDTLGSVSAFAGTPPSQEQVEVVSTAHQDFNLGSLLPAPLYAQRLDATAREPEFRELLQPEFRELLQHAFLGGCRKMIEAGQEAASEKNPAALKAEAQAEVLRYPYVLDELRRAREGGGSYSPGLDAAERDGTLAPLATLVLVLVTLFGALPIYRHVAGETPDGVGSIGMIERMFHGWGAKLVVLVLIGFAATDFVITKTLSAADAAAHLIRPAVVLSPRFILS